jgi:hypothetical protein
VKFLFILLFIIGFAYMWFSTYEPKPSSNSMQGTIQAFQEAIKAKDINGMRRLCSPAAAAQCEQLLDQIREGESRYQTTLNSVGSFGFDYPRGRKEVDGMISGDSTDGDTLFSVNVRVSQNSEGDGWSITHIG